MTKLILDQSLITSLMLIIFNTDRQLGPMLGQEGLVEKLWQILTRKKELLPTGGSLWKAFDLKWIKPGDQIDLLAREIERCIKDELIEEMFLLDQLVTHFPMHRCCSNV
jgi:hypothetical protein